MVSLYHLHQNRFLDDLPFWLVLATETPGPVLELGCGSGRIAIPLALRGIPLFGLDHSELALRLLYTRAPELARPRLHLLRGSFQDFHLAARFGLILMPCNTLSSLSNTVRRSLYARVQTHLRAGGRFVASLPNPVHLAALPSEGDSTPEDAFLHPESGEPVQVSSSWRRTQRMVTVSWHYDHLRSDGTVERESVQTRQDLASYQEYTAELATAGLQLDRSLGDFDGAPYTPDAPHLILFASRT